MGDVDAMPKGTQPIPTSARGHPMPRRASPEQSVTLRHHRLARDASMRPEPTSQPDHLTSPRRDSSNESHATGQSDPKNWFDRSNRNAPAAFDQNSMDIDPPFYQKQSDSSNEEMNLVRMSAYQSPPSAYQSTLRPPLPAHSSSADDFRSVIDDLTVENKRLKEELKRYKQFGPDPLRKDKLFEIKFHGLPHKKKRELEATLRDFASSLEGSTTSSQQRKKSSKGLSRLQGSSLDSKQASSSSSHSRPVDSAYASMSTGPSSISYHASMSSFGRPSLGRPRSSADQKVETYLREIPQGLMPRHVALTDKDKKKVVVRRLEHLFTGKFGGKSKRLQPATPPLDPQSVFYGAVPTPSLSTSAPVLALPQDDPREAQIQLNDSNDRSNSREEPSASNYNGENDHGENPMACGSASNEHGDSGSSPHNADMLEQRATRPLDLDPDRAQIPSENMDYIRHLGAMAPEYLPESKYQSQDVSMDADGWIHLNLLCSLAQLHTLNVTPDYIRSAVSERSAKFQLSRDGRKIRWRGGTHGTKFSSDSSGDSSERSPDAAVTQGSNDDGQRKRQKVSAQVSPASTKLQASASPQGFHYKPMFVHHQSSSLATSMEDDTESQASYPKIENSNMNSRSTDFVSGSVSSPRKKRRRDGAVIYYTGAPFCLDLSGDPGNDSPTAQMASSGQAQESSQNLQEKPELARTTSGSELPFRPLVDGPEQLDQGEGGNPEYVTEEPDSLDTESFGFRWCEQPEKTELKPLQAALDPCGLGGVTPEDHFAILVVTRHPILSSHWLRQGHGRIQADAIESRFAGLTTNSPHLPSYKVHKSSRRVHYQVLQQRYKELKPLPLPPPGVFYPPFTETTDSEDDSGFEEDYEEDEAVSNVTTSDSDEASQWANPHQSDVVRMAEESDQDDDLFNNNNNNFTSGPRVSFVPAPRASRNSSRRPSWEFSKGVGVQPDSSAATAGDASGYSSGREED
ncbi:unnamed protein product [Discula destructiva]